MSNFFTPVEWSYNSNIYEVNLRQYTAEGTFEAFIRELPRLKSMGVEILWFMPITPISEKMRLGSLGSYYACSDYTATNPEYGSLDDFRRLVKEAHALDMKVIIDWVANHTGWDHRWTREHPEFYRRNMHGEYFDPHGWTDVIDLNYDLRELQETMISCMRFWIDECDIDGFRCDMAMLVPLSFWIEARTTLDKIKKLFWLAECEEISYHEVFDATYTWKFLHQMEAFWRQQTNIHGLVEVLDYYRNMFPPNAFHAYFTTNHDENSHSGSEYERMGSAAKTFAVLCCTWNGIPLVYSGQELPNLKRLKFFDKDPIGWTGEYKLHEFYRKLLELRKRNGALMAGTRSDTTRLVTNADNYIFAYLRKNGEDEVLVLLNLSHEEKPLIKITDEIVTGEFTNVFSGITSDFTEHRFFALRPWEFLVYEKQKF